MMWIDIREPYTEKLLFRYEPERDIIEVQRRGVKTVIDLTQYKVVGEIGGFPIVTDPTMQKDEIRFGNERIKLERQGAPNAE